MFLTNSFCKNILIFPDSRLKEIGIDSNGRFQSDLRNVVKVNNGRREKYIELFKNLFPQEIIYFLNNYFWGGMFDYYICPDKKIQEMLRKNDCPNLISFLNPKLINPLNDRKDYNLNNHHIFPRSRISALSFHNDNIIGVDTIKHKNYHILFSNQTPGEILQFLNNVFWNDSFSIILIPNEKMREMLKSVNGHNLIFHQKEHVNFAALVACIQNNQQI